MKTTKSKELLLQQIYATLIHGATVAHNGVLCHEFASFKYNKQTYYIDLEHQHLLRFNGEFDIICRIPDAVDYIPNVSQGTKVPIDIRSREKYMFNKIPADGRNHVVTISQYMLNVLLLIPNAFEKYMDSPDVYSVNHKAVLKQDLLSYECCEHLYARYLAACSKNIKTEDELLFISECVSSQDRQFVELRCATDMLRHQPYRLRVNDISNLELCTNEENALHFAFIQRVRCVLPDIEAYRVSADFAKKWFNSLYSPSVYDKIPLFDAIASLPRVEDFI